MKITAQFALIKLISTCTWTGNWKCLKKTEKEKNEKIYISHIHTNCTALRVFVHPFEWDTTQTNIHKKTYTKYKIYG